jgi:hypothetical protein
MTKTNVKRLWNNLKSVGFSFYELGKEQWDKEIAIVDLAQMRLSFYIHLFESFWFI